MSLPSVKSGAKLPKCPGSTLRETHPTPSIKASDGFYREPYYLTFMRKMNEQKKVSIT